MSTTYLLKYNDDKTYTIVLLERCRWIKYEETFAWKENRAPIIFIGKKKVNVSAFIILLDTINKVFVIIQATEFSRTYCYDHQIFFFNRIESNSIKFVLVIGTYIANIVRI